MRIRKLQDIASSDVQAVGGKAAPLGELLRAGHQVPPGFVVTTEAKHMNSALEKDILKTFDELGLQRVAVRSSGVGEDAKGQSWAGQFATFLHVDRAGLITAVQSCWDSATSARVETYGQAAQLAVLVQQMVNSEVSGVAFSVNPVNTNANEIMIEATYGLCETLVQGLATPDNYIVSKKGGQLISQDIAQKKTQLVLQNGGTAEVAVETARQNQPALSETQLQEVAQLVRDIETHYSFPVDIEWAYEQGTLYLLQARPITTL